MDDFDQVIRRATEHYTAMRLTDAVAAYCEAIALRPDVAGVYNNLGSALLLLGRLDEAIAAFHQTLRLAPDAYQTWSNLGNLYKTQGNLDAAIISYRRAIEINPANAEAHNNLGATLEDAGDLPAAIACYERAVTLNPDSAAMGSNYVYALHFWSESTPASLLAAHRAWNDRHAKTPTLLRQANGALPLPSGESKREGQAGFGEANGRPRSSAPLPNPLPMGERTRNAEALPTGEAIKHAANPRRLRVGYISPDFRDHVIGRFMRTILAHHDRAAVEVFCYSDVAVPDAWTAELRSLAEHWRIVLGLPTEMAADRIRNDTLDVLVDLTMHMARNRMPVFARRPARVQATYLAYCSTTGLDAIDFRLTDPYLDPVKCAENVDLSPPVRSGDQPPAAESAQAPILVTSDPAHYSERSIYLPETYWCYESPAEVPAVLPSPAIANGFVTFGCMNSFRKVSPAALAAWCEILRAVPDSRLTLHAKEGPHRQRVQSVLADAGVAPERLTFIASEPLRDYFASYGHIDLALDPFPYGGGTTTLDGLWMGVPIVTLTGRTAVGRAGVSILSNLELSDLITTTRGDYVAKAVTLASDVDGLNAFRQSMRSRMLASPLMNAPRFTRNLERVLARMASGGPQ